jgi:hypothetical protein
LKAAPGIRPPASARSGIVSFRGTKREAQIKLAGLIAAVHDGTHVDPSKTTVGELVRERVALWPCSDGTREHYLDCAKMIERGLGRIQLQRLTTRDVERWHAELGQRLAPRTCAMHTRRCGGP